MAKQIRIKVDAVGNVKVDAENFQGVGCEAATQVFELAFAGRRTDSTTKPEYYEQENVAQAVPNLNF
jgi:hypothetical protein